MPGVVKFSEIKFDEKIHVKLLSINIKEFSLIRNDVQIKNWNIKDNILFKFLICFNKINDFYCTFRLDQKIIFSNKLKSLVDESHFLLNNKYYCKATWLLDHFIDQLPTKSSRHLFNFNEFTRYISDYDLKLYFVYHFHNLFQFSYDNDEKYSKLIDKDNKHLKPNSLTPNPINAKEENREIKLISESTITTIEPKETNDKPPFKKNIKIIPHKQLILFGCPGTGKSHKVNNQYCKELSVDNNSENCIRTVFHPEYDYGDFMGKLLPITKNNKVEYNYYPGHFMKALIASYKNILASVNNKNVEWGEVKNVCLIIDELNRGNTSSIFGNVFQLLDRNNNGEKKGWSTYGVSIANIEFEKLIEELGFNRVYENESIIFRHDYNNLKIDDSLNIKDLEDLIKNYLDIQSSNKIKIPPNLSILCTMNNADTSIYQLDNAFKRRWDMEYVDIRNEKENRKIENDKNWKQFVDNINKFISKNANQLKNVEDKLIGYYFIGEETIKKESIKNKLMFYLWDTVFYNNKKPLEELLKTQTQNKSLLTFGDFQKQIETFITEIYNYK